MKRILRRTNVTRGKMPRSYQATPKVLGRRRATRAKPARPDRSTVGLRVSPPPARGHITAGSDVTAPAPRTMTVTLDFTDLSSEPRPAKRAVTQSRKLRAGNGHVQRPGRLERAVNDHRDRRLRACLHRRAEPRSAARRAQRRGLRSRLSGRREVSKGAWGRPLTRPRTSTPRTLKTAVQLREGPLALLVSAPAIRQALGLSDYRCVAWRAWRAAVSAARACSTVSVGLSAESSASAAAIASASGSL